MEGGGHPTARIKQSCFFISTMAPSSLYSPLFEIIIVLLYLTHIFFWKIISLQYSMRCVHRRLRIANASSLTWFDENNRNWCRIVRNIKITKITNHKWNHRLSLMVRMERGRTLQLEQHYRLYQEKFNERHRKSFPSVLHSHPFSLIICASSIINFPSLYFWLDSNACS